MRKRQLCIICLPVLIWLIIMGFYSGGISEKVYPPVEDGNTILVQGTIYKMESNDSEQTICLKDISIISEESSQLENLPNKIKMNILVYLKNQEEIHIGNRVQVKGICAYFRAPRNPGGFDAYQYYYAQNIEFSVNKAVILKNDRNINGLQELLYQFKLLCSRQIDGICSEDTGAILKAMLLGNKRDLSQGTKDLYQSGGIIHVLAISGLHISLLGMGIYKILRKIGVTFISSGVISGVIMTGFCMMTGFAPSAKRAVLMFLIYLGAQAAGRTYDMPNSLMTAAVLILFQNPMMITQAGFLLSFAAAAGVMASDIWQYPWMKKSGFSVSISTWLFTLPLTAWFYFRVPVWGILLNLLVIPFMPVVMISGVIGIGAGVFSSAAGIFCQAPAHYVLQGIHRICELLEKLPGTSVVPGKPSAVQIGIYYLFLLIFCFFFQKKRKIDLIQRTFGIILIITILCASIPKSWTMTVLDVGQGDGICIRMPGGSVWMIDGGSSNQKELARYDIEPYLESHGIDRIDGWIISHFDKDHVSGLLEILEHYNRNLAGSNGNGITIGQILIPDIKLTGEKDAENELEKKILKLAVKKEIPLKRISSGDVFRQEETVFRVLAPEKGFRYEDRNEGSVVLEIRYKHFSALLTGDVEEDGEERLIQNGGLLDVDFLKAAHHGSKNGTGERFLEIIRPEAAVISCGKDNRYGHPHMETIQRLESVASKIIRTDEYGAVDVIVNESNWYMAKAQ